MTETIALPVSTRRAWIAAGLAAGGSVVVLAIWLFATPTWLLREQLKAWQPWSLDVCVLAGALVTVYLLSTIDRDVYKREVPRIALLAALGLALTLFVAPRTNRIFYDEQIYQGIAQNIADVRLAQVCNDGSVEYGRLRCGSGEYNKQPYGYPHALSLAFRLVGVHTWTAFAVNAAAMALTICAVYLLAYVLFADREAALFAGLLIALTPEQLLWSATAAVEPSASLVLVVALLAAALYWKRGGWAALAGVVVASAYAVQFRPESILILPVIGPLIWPRLRPALRSPGGWWAVAAFVCLVAVHVGHLVAVRHIDWGTVGPRFSFRYIEGNLRVNGWFYLFDERFPVLFTALAVVGLLSGRDRREAWLVAKYFVLFFAIDLVFYAGSYNYGADVRYSLMTYPPIAVLGGLGAAHIARFIGGLSTRVRADGPARTLIVVTVLLQFLWYAPVVRATTEEAWAARADVRFAQEFARAIPRNSYVLTHNPSMFHLWGVNAGQMSLVSSNPAYLRYLAERYSGGVYLHWNFWCNVQDPIQVGICRKAFGLAPGNVVTEYRERDQRFAFYRLKVVN
jgi:4-amino-4-deoxy-L-arabinose transferase-like glycosyltransferase